MFAYLNLQNLFKLFLSFFQGALLCSLSKGSTKHIRLLIDCNIIQTLIKKLMQCSYTDHKSLIEICLRTFRSIFTSGLAPVHTVYTSQNGDAPFIAYLLNLASPGTFLKTLCNDLTGSHLDESKQFVNLFRSQTWCIQECVLNILTAACQSVEHQNMLCEYSCIQMISDLLQLNIWKMNRPALNLLGKICHRNPLVATVAVNTISKKFNPETYQTKGNLQDDIKMLESLNEFLSLNHVQLEAAKSITYLFRANALDRGTSKLHELYVHKTLKVLTKLCKTENEPEVRVEAARVLAFLIELDVELQKITAICDHIIPTLAEYFKYVGACSTGTLSGTAMASGRDNSMVDNGSKNKVSTSFKIPTAVIATNTGTSVTHTKYEDEKLAADLKEAAFLCFASLASSNEDIRLKIIATDQLMENTVNGLADPTTRVRLAALRCLHSLSRSVQQLRTTFQDHAVWIPLKTLLLATTDDNILSVASSTLCNLLVEFSPSKQHFLDRSAFDLLCSLTKHEQSALRLNGVWALMNMAFQADQTVKMQTLDSLGIDHIFKLLSDSDTEVILKTLGLIRNLLSTKTHIDFIMSIHGNRIMEAVKLILNSSGSASSSPAYVEIQEQAICILANIANGDSAKVFIMQNEAILKQLLSYLDGDYDKLQLASVCCVNNLIWNSESGAAERQKKLKELGIYKVLVKLLDTKNDALFDKIKTAMLQYQNINP